MKYQYNFSSLNPSMLDHQLRSHKAKKIASVLLDFARITHVNLQKTTVLDIGGSAGFSAKAVAQYVKKVTVIDIDDGALSFGKKHNAASNITYAVDDAMKLSFADNSFDIIICNQVYEHVPSHEHLASEMYRVLKPGGFCYFGGNNVYMIMEPHYRLPFLSWFPQPFADTYIKLFRGHDSYHEKHLSFSNLHKLFNRFQIHDYTVRVIKHPDVFTAGNIVGKHTIIGMIPDRVFTWLLPIIPGYIFILTKPS